MSLLTVDKPVKAYLGSLVEENNDGMFMQAAGPGGTGSGEPPKTGGGHPIVDEKEVGVDEILTPDKRFTMASFVPSAVLNLAKKPNVQLLVGATMLLSIGYYTYNQKK